MAIPQTEAEVVARVAELSAKGIPMFRLVDPNEPLLADKMLYDYWKELDKEAPQ